MNHVFAGLVGSGRPNTNTLVTLR